MPSPGPSFARAQPLRLHGPDGSLGPRVRLGMTKPTVMVDDWWVFTLWVEDDEGVVECRAVAPLAGPPPGAPLQVIGPTLANSLMGLLDQEDERQLIRMRMAEAEDEALMISVVNEIVGAVGISGLPESEDMELARWAASTVS